MTDAEVLNAVKTIRASHKRAATVIAKRLASRRQEIFAQFGSSDVEQASRGMALRKAESEAEEAQRRADLTCTEALSRIRAIAGEWADLVR